GDSTPTGASSVLITSAGILAGATAGAVTAFALERTAYRPLRRRGAPRLAYLISAIGASYFLLNLAGKEFGRLAIPMPDLYVSGTVFHIFGAAVSTNQLVIFGATIVMLVALDRLVAQTRLGPGIRAVPQAAQTATLLGLDINQV